MYKTIFNTIGISLMILFSFSLKAQSPKINLTISKEIVIDAEISKCWHVLGPEFADAYKWASTVDTSEGKGSFIDGEIFSERICLTPMGTLKEKILEYSEGKHLLSYQFEGMPKMVRFARNTWQLSSLGSHKSHLLLKMEMEIGGIGKLMKPMMKMKMAKMAKHTIEEFKYYVETGKPHPRKLKAANKYFKKHKIK